MHAGRLRAALADAMGPSERYQGQDKNPVAHVAEEVAEPEAERHQSPECDIAPTLVVGAVARTADGEPSEDDAGKDV